MRDGLQSWVYDDALHSRKLLGVHKRAAAALRSMQALRVPGLGKRAPEGGGGCHAPPGSPEPRHDPHHLHEELDAAREEAAAASRGREEERL
eukprot:1706364-Lingulodinium_polyedra.AAC.1